MNPGRSNDAFAGGRDQGVHLEGEQLGGLDGFCVDEPDAVGVVAVLAKRGNVGFAGAVHPQRSLRRGMATPAWSRKRAAFAPTLPKPWTAAVVTSSRMPCCSMAKRALWKTPSEVAEVRPSESPTRLARQ